MRKIFCLLIVFCITFCMGAAAYEFPHALWQVNDAFTAALNSGDYYGIINYGLQTLDIMAGEPENTEVLQICGHRTEQIAIAYEKLGDYPSAAVYFEKYKYYAEKLNYSDAVKIASAKVLQYTPEINLYTPAQGGVFYSGARLEQESGVFYGAPTDQIDHRNFSRESAVLFYMEFGETNMGLFEKVLKTTAEKGARLEFAWNIKEEGAGIEKLFNSDAYTAQVLALIEKYNNVPVYIRLGAEMNTWTTRADPERFKEGFRHITNLVRGATTNTAMVWSVAYASSWDINMEDYYPGNEYVDYIGVSLYMNRYFQGRSDIPENEKYTEICFFTGDSADPVKMLDEVTRKFPDKPIIIAESGASHHVRTTGEDTTYWAINHLNMLYNYVPMVYPQVKLIAHFDKELTAEHSDYALYTNSDMIQRYNMLTASPQFIPAGQSNALSFEKCGDTIYASETLTLYAYTHIFGYDVSNLTYYIDGTPAASSAALPYNVTIDLSSVAEGAHTLTVKDENTGFSKNYTLINEKPIKIILNGNEIETDTVPVLVNGRTMVPVRVISESLKCSVSWDEASETVTVEKEGKIIILQIGSNVMTINGEENIIDAPAMLHGSRTMVPIRAVSTALGLSVDWNEASNSVILNG